LNFCQENAELKLSKESVDERNANKLGTPYVVRNNRL